MIEPTATLPVFELLRGESVRSEEFAFRGRTLRFRLLDQREISWARAAAQKRVLSELMEAFGDKDTALRLIHQGPNIDSQNDWLEIYILAGALCDASNGAPYVNDGSPHGAADQVADVLNPLERRALMEQYLAFAADHDPSALSEADFQALVEDVKKNGGEASSLNRSAVSLLRSWATTLVCRLAAAEAECRRLTSILPTETTPDHETRIALLEAKVFPTPPSTPG